MLKKAFLIYVVFISVCLSLDYHIVVDKFFNLDDGKYFIQFYVVDKNNNTLFANCDINNISLGYSQIFRKSIHIKNKITIKCKYHDKEIEKIFFVNNKEQFDRVYNITILNPDYVKYNEKNIFDVYYPVKTCKIKLVLNNVPYDMKKTEYGYYTKTIKVNKGDKIYFLVVCPNKNITFDYNKYVESTNPKIQIKTSNIPDNLKTGDFLLLRFYVIDDHGHRKYDINQIYYELNGKKDVCYLNETTLGFYLKCYLNSSGKYTLKICYNNTCIKKYFNVSKKLNKTEYGFKLLSPDPDVVYNVNKKNLFFRVVVYGKPVKVFEKNTGIVFKNESNRIFFSNLPIKKGKNTYNIFVKYSNVTINRTYTIYASDKVPEIKIYANDTYKLNKSDKITFLIDVKYKNKTLDTGKLIGYIKCSGNVVSEDQGKYDYEKNKYKISFYVFSDGDCTLTVKYYNKDYVTVEKSKNFKVVLDKNYNLDLQITNTFLLLFLIIVSAIIIIIIIKAVF